MVNVVKKKNYWDPTQTLFTPFGQINATYRPAVVSPHVSSPDFY